MIYLTLFFEFFKTGLFAIGGGLATLPFLYDIAEKYDWLSSSIMPDMIAVSESTPGPIGVNMATYAGYNAGYSVGGIAGGILGGVLSTLALVLPSLIIILIVAGMLEKFQNSRLVDDGFKGLRPAVCGLIAAAALTVFSTACLELDLYEKTKMLTDLVDIKAIIMFVVLFVINQKFKPHPILIIIPSAVLGILLKM